MTVEMSRVTKSKMLSSPSRSDRKSVLVTDAVR